MVLFYSCCSPPAARLIISYIDMDELALTPPLERAAQLLSSRLSSAASGLHFTLMGRRHASFDDDMIAANTYAFSQMLTCRRGRAIVTPRSARRDSAVKPRQQLILPCLSVSCFPLCGSA